ncbi:type II toxin-antitoxin system VapC family toxin [Candidatus Berkelbacteria bacterium]|nr:type II toxin-antitoxin system VapC family toxin [Candidatus Berkelbacteria bacterium]
MYTLDTNILIYYAAGELPVTKFIFDVLNRASIIYLPTITVVEFLAFPAIKENEEVKFIKLLNKLNLVSLDSQIAFDAAKIRRQYRISLRDSVVAATALFTRSKLLTRNVRDFKKIAKLDVVEL